MSETSDLESWDPEGFSSWFSELSSSCGLPCRLRQAKQGSHHHQQQQHQQQQQQLKAAVVAHYLAAQADHSAHIVSVAEVVQLHCGGQQQTTRPQLRGELLRLLKRYGDVFSIQKYCFTDVRAASGGEAKDKHFAFVALKLPLQDALRVLCSSSSSSSSSTQQPDTDSPEDTTTTAAAVSPSSTTASSSTAAASHHSQSEEASRERVGATHSTNVKVPCKKVFVHQPYSFHTE